MDTLNNRSIRCSNSFNKNEALAKVIVEDDELYGELRRRLKNFKVSTNMGIGEALNSTIMKSMEQRVYMKYPELEQDLSRQEEESLQGSQSPASDEHQNGGLAAAIASSFQSLMVRVGNENSNTNNTASLGSGQGVTNENSAIVGRRSSLMQTTSTPMAARNRAAASSRRRGSLAGSFLDAFFIIEDVEEEEEQPALNIDPKKCNLRRADSYDKSLPPTLSSSLPRQEVSERLLETSSSSQADQSSWVTSTAPQIIGGALSRMGRASLSHIDASVETDVVIPQQAATTHIDMKQHAEPSSQQQSVLVASEVDQTTSECYFGAWDNDEDCTSKRMY
jgi:hypothetical protein